MADPFADTLQTMSGHLRQFVPELPQLVAIKMVRDAYRRLLDWPSDGWSFQYGQAQFITFQSIQGNCIPIQGQSTVQQVVPTNGIATAQITPGQGGTGYQVGDFIYPVNGGFGILVVSGVIGSAAATVNVQNAGYNNQVESGIPTTTNGGGTGAQVDILSLGNGSLPGDRTTIVGRQVLFGGQAPVISIVDNQNGTSFVTDEPYAGVTGQVSFEITCVYFTPSDPSFEAMKCFVDPPNGCQLPYSFTFEELNNIDPQRTSSGTPYLLADVDWNINYLSQLPTGVTDCYGYTNQSSPVPRKEIYPRNQANYAYTYYYKKFIPDLVNPADKPVAFLARRGEAIREGALADLAMWEGPQILGRRANPVQYNVHKAQFNQIAQELQIKDGSIMQRNFNTYLSATRYPYPASLYGSSFAALRPWLGSDVGMPFGDFDQW